MLGPIPAARARKRAETLFAIATLHLRNRQHCGVRGSGEINGDRYDTTGTRDATVTERRRLALRRVFISRLRDLLYRAFYLGGIEISRDRHFKQ